MNRADLVNRIADQIMSARQHPGGIVGIMLDSERAAGGVPYAVGDEWTPGVVVRRGADVRLVAILAKRPGHGALRRLVERIQAEGLTPVVVEPVGPTMPAIMKRWGWRRTVLNSGWERVEEWRPSAPTTQNAHRPTGPREAEGEPQQNTPEAKS